ncbi:4-(cytidine 5'-diphospho)-2-C-methyl-D-erythritol kinase [Candidatus Bipolaricaulota bacterium]|nr:4-(cytidine 5'-diphospho)-2-C-methyl-D-erythritol kinase [Candidatus Bipolaricaulota bacterium]
MTVRLLAYAKLNLSLEICGRRADGMHEIRSIAQTIDLADRIQISARAKTRVFCDESLDGPNIVEKAAAIVLREKRSRGGLEIRIEKRIPVGAGLGGGSSDAAAVLVAANKLLPPLIGDVELIDMASSLGADVPLFLTGGCMRLTGVGHPEQKMPTRSEVFVLVVPEIRCATVDVYREWRSSDAPSQSRALGQNDLYPAAARLHPELRMYHDAITQTGGKYSGMTGSGSAFYAAFGSCAEAMRARDTLARQELGCRVYCCRATATGCAEAGGEEA